MNEKLFQPPWGFLSLPQAKTAPDAARAWVLPVPYDATVCYGSGTRNGPAAEGDGLRFFRRAVKYFK